MPKQRSHGDGEIRERPDGRWEARIRLANGKRKSVYGKTRRDVQTKLKALKRDIEHGVDLSQESLRTSEYIETWLESERDSLRPSTLKGYESYIRRHIIPNLGHLRLKDLSATHVNKMLNEMGKQGLSPRSRNLARAILRKALNDAIDADILVSNAAAKAKAAREQGKNVEPLTPEQVKTLISFTRDHWMGPLIHIALGTGLRQGELLALRWQDVNFQEKSIQVQNTLTRLNGQFVLSPPKTDKSQRKVFLDDSSMRALERQAKQIEEARLVAGTKWVDWGLVFSSTNGTPQHNSNVTHRVQKLMEEAGVPRKTFHNLRHSAASLLYANGADIKMIQEVLGHSQIALTANTYTHLDEAMRKEAAVKMGAALGGLDGD